MNIEEDLTSLKEIVAIRKERCHGFIESDSCFISTKRLETLLTAYEKEKEKNKLLEENYSSAHEDINWFCENYISKEVSEQKERKAYIKGTNDADELCNKKWKDKIKAKTIEIKNRQVKDEFITASQGKLNTIIEMESLLEKE